jgi:hypothetical protein
VLINGKTLSTSNIIPASSLEGTATTAAPCPTQYCNAGCRLVGAIGYCSTTCVTPTSSCTATSTPIEVSTTTTTSWTNSINYLTPQATAPPFYGRILPLGASIVWGNGSTTGDGYVIYIN